MKNNKKWFSLIIAMWLVLVITLLAFTVLEYIVPFWRDIKWIENSSVAYYQANSAIEDWLYKVYERNYSWALDMRTEYYTSFSWLVTNKYSTTSSWKTIPLAWDWNSNYDINYNTIAEWNPIQLSIWKWLITNSTLNITFKIPNLDWWSLNVEQLSLNDPIVNWQLSSNSNTLNATWSYIYKNLINGNTQTNLFDPTYKWVDLNWSTKTFSSFYTSNCTWTNSGCILKLSVINKLLLTSWEVSPYLEWKINVTWTNPTLPQRYTKLKSSGKSYWFTKDINIRVPAPTVNEAFDFTVFQ